MISLLLALIYHMSMETFLSNLFLWKRWLVLGCKVGFINFKFFLNEFIEIIVLVGEKISDMKLGRRKTIKYENVVNKQNHMCFSLEWLSFLVLFKVHPKTDFVTFQFCLKMVCSKNELKSKKLSNMKSKPELFITQ